MRPALLLLLLLAPSVYAQQEQRPQPAPDSAAWLVDLPIVGPPMPGAFAAPPDTAATDTTAADAPADSASVAAEGPTAALLLSIVQRQARLEARNDSLNRALAAARADTSGSVGDQVRETAEKARETIQGLGIKAFLSILVLIGTAYVIRFSVWLLNALAAQNADQSLRYKRFIPVVRILTWAIAAYLVISVIIGLTGEQLIAASAAAGVAIGFAAQDVLKNIFGGLVIIFDQPFQVGDKVAVGDTYGEVVSIGIRSTRIVTPDDNLVSVPNSQITDGQVSNANAGVPDCQVVTDLFLPIWADEGIAKRVAYEAAAASQLVYMGKPIVVLLKEVFDKELMLRVRVKAYVLEHQYEFGFMSEITQAARREYRRLGLLSGPDGLPGGAPNDAPHGDRPDAPTGTERPPVTPIASRVE
jgi:small-conductance mechanosensitive channel